MRTGARNYCADPLLGGIAAAEMTLLGRLEHVTANIGRDRLLTQGAGGNTSFKCDEDIWVKASGAWMCDAEVKRIFVSMSLSRLMDAVRSGDERRIAELSARCAAASGLRPSIEAVLHAVMPQRAVIHAHAINSVVCSVLADGGQRFMAAAGRLGVRARVLAYAKPGLPLAREVARRNLEHGVVDVLLLQNHGVVVAAGDPEEALHLLHAVEKELAWPVWNLAPVRNPRNESDTYEWDELHSTIACEERLCARIARAPLTPDQVVFLGGAPSVLPAGDTLRATTWRTLVGGESRPTPALAYVPGRGAFRRMHLSPGQLAQSEALYEVARRLAPDAEVVGLTSVQAGELLGWEAEKFRIAADAARDAPSDDAGA